MDQELVEFVRSNLDREEWWAVEVSRCSPDRGWTLSGEHWTWQDNRTGETVKIDPMEDEFLPWGDEGCPYLGSTEQYPYNAIGGEGPHLVLCNLDEIPTVFAGYIVNNDPATTLADIESKRRLIDAYEASGGSEHLEFALWCAANRWRERSGFQLKWSIVPIPQSGA